MQAQRRKKLAALRTPLEITLQLVLCSLKTCTYSTHRFCDASCVLTLLRRPHIAHCRLSYPENRFCALPHTERIPDHRSTTTKSPAAGDLRGTTQQPFCSCSRAGACVKARHTGLAVLMLLAVLRAVLLAVLLQSPYLQPALSRPALRPVLRATVPCNACFTLLQTRSFSAPQLCAGGQNAAQSKAPGCRRWRSHPCIDLASLLVP